MTTYRIERFYRDDRPTEIIATGYTLEDAQAWCQREDSHGDGWFDGYRAEQASGYQVRNNITGNTASVIYDTVEKASMVCRVLNTPAMGGLYGVYTADGVRVP